MDTLFLFQRQIPERFKQGDIERSQGIITVVGDKLQCSILAGVVVAVEIKRQHITISRSRGERALQCAGHLFRINKRREIRCQYADLLVVLKDIHPFTAVPDCVEGIAVQLECLGSGITFRSSDGEYERVIADDRIVVRPNPPCLAKLQFFDDISSRFVPQWDRKQ